MTVSSLSRKEDVRRENKMRKSWVWGKADLCRRGSEHTLEISQACLLPGHQGSV